MDERRWQDAMKALEARSAPTRAETELFVRAVMARLEPAPSPWARWLVPALSVGLATVFLMIGRQPATDDVELLLGAPGAEAAALAVPADPSRPLMVPEAP